MKQRNVITLTLMISSIVLLIILQVFWLHNSYEKAYFDFRRQTSGLFRTTAFALRDSIILKNVVPVSADSIDQLMLDRKLPGGTLSKTIISGVRGRAQRMEIDEEHTKVRLFVSGEGDTIRNDIIGPITSQIANIQSKKAGTQKSFILRISPDTLNIDTLRRRFQQALQAEGLSAQFTINHFVFKPEFEERVIPRIMDGELWVERSPLPNIFSDTLRSEPVRINPIHRYSASLTGIREILLKQISPQLFFSVFLMVITTASFIFMYRNIRMQQRLMESKNEFINNVTHELKTPVATVSVALEALKNFNAMHNPKLTEEYLDIALRELQRLSGMTDKILNASLIEQQGLKFEKEEVDLDNAVREMLNAMKIVLEKKNATVNYQTFGENFHVVGSTLHLTNVLFNLVDNALKYSDGKPVINMKLTADERTIKFSITDRGVGIPMAYQRKIFEKFFRVPTGDVHNIKGYGLGLSYVASVVKSHAGTIDVISKPGEGSTFIVTLPRTPGQIHKVSFKLPKPDQSTHPDRA